MARCTILVAKKRGFFSRTQPSLGLSARITYGIQVAKHPIRSSVSSVWYTTPFHTANRHYCRSPFPWLSSHMTVLMSAQLPAQKQKSVHTAERSSGLIFMKYHKAVHTMAV